MGKFTYHFNMLGQHVVTLIDGNKEHVIFLDKDFLVALREKLNVSLQGII